MKLKLDENLGSRIATLLRSAGHDVATVPGQGLSSTADTQLIEVLIAGLEQAEIAGKLWIIRRGVIQEYQPVEPEETDE
ncbi:MAG: DUF5615 family PIN-like protein [Coleofasciculus sp. C1-SOL-03]|uniref:DUF5615 family PIN-like protein n=1 Tax=Coleofasciculus sp. C1-SOL-03 TaxID=3069522 RepID=UPI0033024EA0